MIHAQGEEGFNVKKSLPCTLIIFFAASSLTLAIQKKSLTTTASKPSVISLKCPDITVSGMNATLVSTLLGDPQVEFPMDTVKLEATLENSGTEAVPLGTFVYIILKRNGEVVRSTTATDPLGAPGSSWTYSVNDSFPHGQKTTYILQASSTLKECRLSNNLAALTIDEKKLHPQGDPDLTVTMFSIEKRWQQDGDHFKASFYLAADVANDGTGTSSSASRLLFLINGNQELAVMNIAQEALPGPGQKKRYTAVVPAAKVPTGDHMVQASIEPPQNERNTQNNLSANSAQITHSTELPAGVIAVLEFTPWRLTGKKLSTTIKMTNLQNQDLHALRLIMLREGVPVKEWRPLSFNPRETFRVRFEEELQPSRVIFGQSHFRALLTSDAKKNPPANNSILDERMRELCWVEMGEGVLRQNLLDRERGLAAQVYRKNKDYRVQETQVRISADGISIQVKGKKITGRSPDMDFRAAMLLSPRLAAGRVYFETIKTDVQVSSGPSDFFGTLFAPLIFQSVKAAIEKFVEKELAVNLPPAPAPGSPNSQYGAPLGIILVDGALDMYY
jgi:hypothetical protein